MGMSIYFYGTRRRAAVRERLIRGRGWMKKKEEKKNGRVRRRTTTGASRVSRAL